jgi:Ca2+-binding RTX toxin-like protein
MHVSVQSRARRTGFHGGFRGGGRRTLAMTAVTAVVSATAVSGVLGTANAAPAPVGNGFTVTASDIAFILKQIQIAERHSATLTTAEPCRTQLGTAPDQVPDELTSYGLRTVDGSCNNLFAGRERFAAADEVFPRLTDPDFRSAEVAPPGFPGAGSPTTYLGDGNVVDSQPRTVSNLIVDQTSTNPAAVAAAAFPVRAQGGNPVIACTTDPTDPTDPTTGVPAGCVPSHQTLFIENVTTDVGLSPPYNSMFTFFGQFFDHGVDQTVKSGSSVFVPLRDDDPLIAGPDHVLGNGDDLPPNQRFMVLTRAQNQPGGDQNATNTDTPWVDQSQTYTSHSSHQVFLREYIAAPTPRPAGAPAALSTGAFLEGLPAGETYQGSPSGEGGISTWAAVKKQAAERLGLLLVDKDVLNVPMLAVDPYGNFIPGPARGLPQYVTATGLVEGNLASPVAVPANVLYFDTPFVGDIAHNAEPTADTDHNPATPNVALTPDTDSTPSADFASQPAGTYDDEMLNAHFACGDGRCNENIALTTIHQVFHSEHNRLVEDITATLNLPENAALLAAYRAPHTLTAGGPDISYGFGGRLFQAARFVTEMEYQHLVFEEFARKVQPAIRVFHVYSPDIQPAIQAEFAHAVYRFGHSMLDDDVARFNGPVTSADDPDDNSLPLLTAFLNPPEFFHNGSGTYTAREAAGAVVMGSSDQAGNELDEFVTETLRNNLLGLPLDLPTINMARAREAGVPRLNDVRRQIFERTNDGQLAPYTNWSDFGQHLKHPESLINFVAAYGTHPSITGTLQQRRDAARAIVDPRPAPVLATDPPADIPPPDAADFMFGTGSWASDANGRTTTGLDDVDLWVGGLAEVTNLFGGLLGSTFNYVFQTQLESLQDGDRLYYLARTPGMNLRTQLEGNSFSEMIQRNTEGTNTLKADAFATADCKFQMANIVPGTTAGSVLDDPDTECDESLLLLRQPDGRIDYRQRNTVDPTGINAQSVYNGTPGVDRIHGGNDNDTFWGGLGNDVIDGQGGDDVMLGGEGDDILTDLDGADVPKGGPGDDAIDGGPGDDIPMGGDGQDFINGGSNADGNETFAGPGTDFIIAGQGADAAFGDGGDDWIQGGSGQDLLLGDHAAPFFDDPAQTAPGNDVFIGQVGENDYDGEGGDDLMAQNAAVDRNAGSGGFDWAFHQYDTVGGNDDMEINNNLVGVPIQQVVNRDRWQEVEADSGSAFDDVIRGHEDAPATVAGAGFTGCNALDPIGVARITGLNRLVGTFPTQLAPIVAASAPGYCPLTGQGGTAAGTGTVWAEGDILLGGGGSDTFTGRGADDIIDGDHAVSVRISVRDAAGTELGSTDLMENVARTGNFGPGTTGMTLQQAVFAGLVDPGNLRIVREIQGMGTTAATGAVSDCGAASPVNCDTAVFTDAQATYTVTRNANGSVTVDSNGGNDGIDTLWNVERAQFTDGTIALGLTVTAQSPAANATNVAVGSNVTATFNQVVQGVSGTTFTLRNTATNATVAAVVSFNATTRVATLNPNANLAAGTNYTATLTGGPTAIRDLAGSPLVTTSWSFTTAAPVGPVVTARTPAVNATGVAVGTNVTATFDVVVQGVSGTSFTLRNTATGNAVAAVVSFNATTRVATLNPNANLLAGTTYTATLTGGATAIRNAAGTPLATTSWSFTTAANTTPPTVTLRSPAVNATAVAAGTNVTATFNEAVLGVNGTTFRLTNAASGAVIGAAVTQNGTTNQWILNPTANLANDTTYRVTLTGGTTAIRDLAGTPLATVTWTFTTGPAPTLTARAPAVNATGVARANNITATFSEAVQGVSTTTFVIRPAATPNSTPIAGTVTRNGTTNQWILNPSATLAANTQYRVTLTGGPAAIRDGAGNPLTTVTWTFTTGA